MERDPPCPHGSAPVRSPPTRTGDIDAMADAMGLDAGRGQVRQIRIVEILRGERRRDACFDERVQRQPVGLLVGRQTGPGGAGGELS